MSETSVQTALLVYDAMQEVLSGAIGDRQFYMRAYSGGSRGHQANVTAAAGIRYLHAKADTLSSRFANTKLVKQGSVYKQRGGTLPPGHYECSYVAHHPSFGECIRLHRSKDAEAIHSPYSPHPIPHGRDDDFFIHGAGPKGSDGCIVPADRPQRLQLNKAVSDFPGRVVLLVKNVAYQLPAELCGQLA